MACVLKYAMNPGNNFTNEFHLTSKQQGNTLSHKACIHWSTPHLLISNSEKKSNNYLQGKDKCAPHFWKIKGRDAIKQTF